MSMLRQASMLAAWLTTAALAAGGPGAAAAQKKPIATGWDMATPARLRENLQLMEQRPFHGVVIRFADRSNRTLSYAFNAEVWEDAWIEEIIDDLKACGFTRFTDNFLLVNANPGDVDWFDDAGWSTVVDHWRAAARAAREGGLRGILFDPEPYRKPYRQFDYTAQAAHADHTLEEYLAKARERGREVMGAVAGEYPDLTLFCYFMNSVNAHAADRGDPRRAAASGSYGLYPAFIDGWLDAAPPTITFVDGCESAYRFNDELQYLIAANRIKGICQQLVAPENRYKYRAQVQAGFGLYLDAYVNPPDSPWYIDPKGQPVADRLRANAETALRVADEYVWVYGEKYRWWPTPNERVNEEAWPDALPGIEEALRFAGDPLGYAREFVKAHPDRATNRLRNGDFSDMTVVDDQGNQTTWQEGRPPAGWGFWQRDDSSGAATWDRQVGAAAPGAARLSGVLDGCFTQAIPAEPGERYAFFGKARAEGEGDCLVRIRWQTTEAKWYASSLDRIFDAAAADEDGWWEVAGVATVPEGAGKIVVLLIARGQLSPDDRAWYDDVTLVKLD
jgi:hypothetical protein